MLGVFSFVKSDDKGKNKRKVRVVIFNEDVFSPTRSFGYFSDLSKNVENSVHNEGHSTYIINLFDFVCNLREMFTFSPSSTPNSYLIISLCMKHSYVQLYKPMRSLGPSKIVNEC